MSENLIVNSKENEILEDYNSFDEMINPNNLINELFAGGNFYCSMPCDTFEEKQLLFNIQSGKTERVNDYINETINLKNVYVQIIKCTDTQTGELIDTCRIILIDDDKNGYACVSIGIFSSLKSLFALFGTPDKWESPIKIKFKDRIKPGGKRTFYFEIVNE
ncbi:MAG: hypothetical protein HFG28_16280 [Eubacterium sp.]|nr:hypothetical protein [Eubacterium sp.]